jgi:hypothetical protein
MVALYHFFLDKSPPYDVRNSFVLVSFLKSGGISGVDIGFWRAILLEWGA